MRAARLLLPHADVLEDAVSGFRQIGPVTYGFENVRLHFFQYEVDERLLPRRRSG